MKRQRFREIWRFFWYHDNGIPECIAKLQRAAKAARLIKFKMRSGLLESRPHLLLRRVFFLVGPGPAEGRAEDIAKARA